MRLYLECSMGASGDMLMAALYELLPDGEVFNEKMKRLGLTSVTLEYSKMTKCGITGTHITVKVGQTEEKSEDVYTLEPTKPEENTTASDESEPRSKYRHSQSQSKGASAGEDSHNGEYHMENTQKKQTGSHPHPHYNSGFSGRHYGYDEILNLIRNLDLPDNVLEDALGVYIMLGKAEAAVHCVPLNKIHFHEIGSLDAVTDIVGCCLLINMLGVTDITVSAVHVGSGFVRCEHGVLPVPAPATAEILKGIPIYSGQIMGELCTPTGAALLKHFATRFGEMPPMTVTKIGYGMGTKEYEAANCLRAFLSEDPASEDVNRDMVCEISCNLDDMTPEAVGATFEVLLENGALDVYITPIIMKKNRPAVKLSCLCVEDMREKLARLIIEHTSTLGVRITMHRRNVLSRTIETVTTKYGDIRIKFALGFGVMKHKPEYDDVLAAAKKYGVPYKTVYDAAILAAEG